MRGWLILAALAAVYIVLGVLYESFIHPDYHSLYTALGRRGCVAGAHPFQAGPQRRRNHRHHPADRNCQKDGIMMVDFAMEGERVHGKNSTDAIYDACLLRFRPIMMTTMAALLAGIPLAVGQGMGSELRRPLGIAMVGGLLLSQVLTLYTTPVIYIFFDRIGQRFSRSPKVIETANQAKPAEAT